MHNVISLMHNLRQSDINPGTKSTRGAALILVLLVLLVIMVLSVSLLTLAQNSHLQSKTEKRSIQAKYLARAGLDAAMEYWRTSSAVPKPAGTMETVYLMKSDHTYQRASTLTAEQIANDTIGQVVTTITKNPVTNVWTIEATATVQGTVHKETAVSGPFVYGHELNPSWYNRNSGEILRNTANVSTSDGNTLYSHNEVHGVVLMQTAANRRNPNGIPLYLTKNKDQNKIVYPAEALFFKSPVHLDLVGSRHPQGFLVASAEDVVFEQELTVGCDDVVTAAPGLDCGFLILNVPAGLGIDGTEVYHNVTADYRSKVNLNARYGLVFFADVQHRILDWSGWRFRSDGDLSNNGFYFIQQDGGVPIGSLINTQNSKNYTSFWDYLRDLLNRRIAAQFFDDYHDAYCYLTKQDKWSTRAGDAQLIPVDPAKVTRPSADDLVVFSYR